MAHRPGLVLFLLFQPIPQVNLQITVRFGLCSYVEGHLQKFISFWSVSSNKLSSINISSVFIVSLKGLSYYLHLARHQINQ